MTESEKTKMFDKIDSWTETECEKLRLFLFEQADFKYKKFHSSLVPDSETEYIIGVRMPLLRQIGKDIAKGNPRSFLDNSFRDYYEERMLRGIVTGLIQPDNFKDFCALSDSFISDIDNWALCDGFCVGLKMINKYREEFFEYIITYLDSENNWAKRTAFVIMLNYYLDDEYIEIVLKRCNKINSDAYYVCMAQAWLLATALAKCESATMEFFKNNALNTDTFNKAVQKCIESKRISAENKVLLLEIKSKRMSVVTA